MLVTIIADTLFARRESDLLARLEVGLADEGVRVVHALPEELVAEQTGGLYSTTVGFEERGMVFSRGIRAARLEETIRVALDQADPKIDLVHAFGSRAWHIALELARHTKASLLLELCDASSISAAAAISSRRVGVRPVEFSVPEAALRRALRKRAHNAHVHVAPWGVHASPTLSARSPLDRSKRPLAVAVLTEGRDPIAIRGCLTGLCEAVRDKGEMLVFASAADGRSNKDPAVWAIARELDILERFSLVPDLEARREPILQMDMLLIPEAIGKHRTLLLDAMAAGVAIVAAHDELIECLIDRRTAALVPDASPTSWTLAISRLVDDPTALEALRKSAHEFVRAERSASAHVSAITTAYNALVAAAQVGVKM